MKFSLILLPEHPIGQLIEIVELADNLGFYACYSADEVYHKDMWQILAVAAARTTRIRLGPDVTPVFLRDPAFIAQQIATLDELSRGRAEAVLSIGNIAMLEQCGVDWRGRGPLRRLREAYTVIRTLLEDGKVDFQGDFYRYAGVFTAARPAQQRVPLMLGGMRGPKSFELAGEIADGLHHGLAHSAESIRYALEHVRAGAERHGLDYDRALPAIEALGHGDVARAIDLTSARIGEALSIAGTPGECVERIKRDIEGEGFNHVVFELIDPFLIELWSGVRVEGLPDLAGQLRLIHQHVLPAFR